MSELARHAPRNQIWITRGHLAALAVTTTAIAVLAFMVGLEVGRSDGDGTEPGPPAAAAFLPDASDEEALEALLHQVEVAAAAGATADDSDPVDDIRFNRDLPLAEAPGAPPAPPATSVVTALAPGPDAPPQAPTGDGDGDDSSVPSSGWAVQIASYEDVEEARAHVARLAEQELAAYSVAALVGGTTWHRVRVGGYRTQEDAQAARSELSLTLGLSDLMVAAAP